MNDVVFPVYVLCRDSQEIQSFPSYEVMRGFLEAIDVENGEYEAFDGDGVLLTLNVGQPKSNWLKIGRMQTQLSESEFAARKAKAERYQEREPLRRRLGRKLGLVKAKS